MPLPQFQNLVWFLLHFIYAYHLEETPKKKQIQTERKTTQRAINVDFENLTIVIESGKGLAPKDTNGKSDPYLRVFCGPYKYKTKVIISFLLSCWFLFDFLTWSIRLSKKLLTLCGLLKCLKFRRL